MSDVEDGVADKFESKCISGDNIIKFHVLFPSRTKCHIRPVVHEAIVEGDFPEPSTSTEGNPHVLSNSLLMCTHEPGRNTLWGLETENERSVTLEKE